MNSFSQNYKPIEIRVKKEEKVLEIDFDNGASFCIPAELLRVESPSAEVQGHGPSQKKLITGRRHVGIIGVEPLMICMIVEFILGMDFMILVKTKKSSGKPI